MAGRCRSALRMLAWTPCLLAMLLIMPACNIVGPAAYIIAGPPTVDAEYALQDRPTVVFVDDRENVVNPVALRRTIADKVSEELMVRKLVTRTISPHDAMSLAARHDTHKDVMPIDAIGRAVGAEQIIYIEMLAFQDNVDGYIPRAMGVCRVRVIDVANRKRIYPPEDADQPYRVLQVMTREIAPEMYRSRSTRYQIGEMLAAEVGDRVTKLFYKHEPRELGGRLQPR